MTILDDPLDVTDFVTYMFLFRNFRSKPKYAPTTGFSVIQIIFITVDGLKLMNNAPPIVYLPNTVVFAILLLAHMP